MEEEHPFWQTKPLIPAFSSTPIPSLSLSAAGLLALADLHTVAQRTVITGGSSWLDALVLAPGLQYQQAVDALSRTKDPLLSAVLQSPPGQSETIYSVNNAAMAQYIRRLWQEASPGGTPTLNVGVMKGLTPRQQVEAVKRALASLVTRRKGRIAHVEIDFLSHVFYLLSPVLTVVASTFMVLLADWWGLSFIVALMASRILNIYSIKQRSRPSPLPVPDKDHDGEYAIHLGDGSRILLRGLGSDIRAMTTQIWLRQQSVAESYFEAAAKLLVYLVAAFSGNQTQAGAMVLMALLVSSAALLGLSNAHARGLQVNGRIARLQGMGLAAAGDSEQGVADGRLCKDLPDELLEGDAAGAS
ncbi:hypothetical protein J3459_013930 [Metarhizium acridum]|uniref:Uncharacterized protein n=1 Tax=Metarhizium acridum (strain CQMa 102) TaxID=655827 RepID=E9E3H5_METAQ|nr:uncharacterized protein MAC_04423 [Metarhizium acridum CQMa 102]EFY89568.1 hypothetical protein MAC_04423 [Metarhizium acridum CQMa 102]KAG8406673.1 hypothetical protein J3458_021012 [Metarhizium acridum]KAG8414732.1 hypothetical protein J3459_014093 [Metarhizium acridum]KAG8415868.1 hypothetical protein J3459_013930 [Metarhizium acridum]